MLFENTWRRIEAPDEVDFVYDDDDMDVLGKKFVPFEGTWRGIEASNEVVDILGGLTHVHAAHLRMINVIRNMIMIMEDLSPRSTAQE